MHCALAKRKKLVTARSFPRLSWHKLPHHHLNTTYTHTHTHTHPPRCTLLITLKCCVRLEHWCNLRVWHYQENRCCTNLGDYLCLPPHKTHTYTHTHTHTHTLLRVQCVVFFIWARALFSQLDFSKYLQDAESLFILPNRWLDYWCVL